MTYDSIPSFSAMLRVALGDALVPEAATFLDMFAEQGVIEFPFAPSGMPQRLEGRAALAAHLDRLGGLVAFDEVGPALVHRATDVFVLEFKGRGRGVPTGAAFEQVYISVIQIDAGRIVHYRDYWNPQVVLETLDAPPRSARALSTEQAR